MNTGMMRSCVWVLALATVAPAEASRTLVHAEQAENLQQGSADGVAVTAKGQFFLAPRVARLGEPGAAGESVHVWHMVADARGGVYLATGPDGRVLRISAAGRHSTF